jgi:hypothetical protein
MFAYVDIEVISEAVRKIVLVNFEVAIFFYTMEELSDIMAKFMF